MEQRRVNGKSQWYHETQSRSNPLEVLPLVPEAAHVDCRFLLDLCVPDSLLTACDAWLQPARALCDTLFPEGVTVTRLQTFSAYDRLSTALTVAQVFGVQRLCNHYAARLTPLPGPDSSRESNRRLAQITQYARQLSGTPSVIDDSAYAQLDEVGLTAFDIVLINQIIGFVGFQARVLAVLQAQLGSPVRWLPGMPALEDAINTPASPHNLTELTPQLVYEPVVLTQLTALASSLQERVPDIHGVNITDAGIKESANEVIRLGALGYASHEVVSLLAWSGLQSWLNRLKIALRNVEDPGAKPKERLLRQ
ncbi:CMD domain-containing protein [Yokenella regensburgei]|uniref:CMD domain-containing protein n=1 Tax=Yokenella regensburgei TaxID=158877 RepID=UPI001432EDCC|nr:CMD domain-containing protein [Yokenella regensburgei]QIU88707.1 CMD domain-containing protein [Yokenella regensburgei]